MGSCWRSWIARQVGAISRRPWRAFALLAVVVGLLGGTGAILHRRWAAAQHLRAAKRDLAEREVDGAWSHLKHCLELYPDHAEAHFLAARTARRCLQYADVEPHLVACERLGWPADALTLERTLRRAQDGDLWGIAGPLNRMVDELDHHDSVVILEALARGYSKILQFAHAEDALDRWLERRPDDVAALFWRGQVYERRANIPRAVADYRRAVELAPDDEVAHGQLAQALLQGRETSEAAGHFEFLLSRHPDHPAAGIGLARCRQAAGAVDEARDLLDRVLAAHPDYGPALAERGKLELQSGEPSRAETWLRKALAQVPIDSNVKYSLALCLQRLNRESEAAALFAEVNRANEDQKRVMELTDQIFRSPRDPDSRAEAGAVSLRLGLDLDAVQWYSSALRLDPRHRASREALATYYERAGKPEIAEQHRRFLTGR